MEIARARTFIDCEGGLVKEATDGEKETDEESQ